MPSIGTRGKKLDLIIKQGATLAPHLVWVKGKNNLEPLNLTDVVIRAKIRKDYDATESYPLTAQVVNGPEGAFRFECPASVTAQIPYLGVHYDPENQYIWDLELVFPTGIVIPMFFGTVKLFGDCTP